MSRSPPSRAWRSEPSPSPAAGKTFSFTGWKVGWACGPATLIAAVRTVKQFLTYVNAAPFQPAVAVGLRLDDDWFARIGADLKLRRDLLCDGLSAAGAEVLAPAATYFATVTAASFGADDGTTLCRELPGRAGVVGVPSATFYDDKEAGRPFVRLAFCKQPALLEQALSRLSDLVVP